jgi:hypothetical protein
MQTAQPTETNVTFNPGKIGFNADRDGVVISVQEGGQAQQCGVIVGMKLKMVDREKYTSDLLRQRIAVSCKTRRRYDILFESSPHAAGWNDGYHRPSSACHNDKSVRFVPQLRTTCDQRRAESGNAVKVYFGGYECSGDLDASPPSTPRCQLVESQFVGSLEDLKLQLEKCLKENSVRKQYVGTFTLSKRPEMGNDLLTWHIPSWPWVRAKQSVALIEAIQQEAVEILLRDAQDSSRLVGTTCIPNQTVSIMCNQYAMSHIESALECLRQTAQREYRLEFNQETGEIESHAGGRV